MRLRNLILSLVLLLVVLVISAVGIMVIASEKALLVSEIHTHENQLIQRLAKVYEESLYQNELLFFNYTKDLRSERGFLEAFFVDQNGRIQIDSDPSKIGKTSASPEEPSLKSIDGVYRQSYTSENGNPLLDLAYPVRFGDKPVGVVRILLDKNVINQFMRETLANTVRRMVGICGLALIVGMLGAIWLARMIVRPIERVVDGMREVAEGRLEPIKEAPRNDELGWLTKELNITIKKLKELDEMKREFVSSVTHEFRSPLTAIESFLSLLIKGSYGPIGNEQKETLLTIKNNTIRLTQFVDDLLTTAKLEAKKMDIYLSEFDLIDVIKDTEILFSSLAKDHNLELKIDVPAQPLIIQSDQKKVSQILRNLVSNAIKFTSKGSVTIQAKRNSEGTELSVVDTGIGISSQDKKNIFEKFFRAAQTATSTKGTGLGLAIVKQFIDLLGARIQVENNPEGGTRFAINFPFPKNNLP